MKRVLTAAAVREPIEDRDAVALGLPFEPRGEVHGVAEHRIVEAQVRAHVADDAVAGVDADADLHAAGRAGPRPRPPARRSALRRSSALEHAQRRLAGDAPRDRGRRAARSRTP